MTIQIGIEGIDPTYKQRDNRLCIQALMWRKLVVRYSGNHRNFSKEAPWKYRTNSYQNMRWNCESVISKVWLKKTRILWTIHHVLIYLQQERNDNNETL